MFTTIDALSTISEHFLKLSFRLGLLFPPPKTSNKLLSQLLLLPAKLIQYNSKQGEFDFDESQNYFNINQLHYLTHIFSSYYDSVMYQQYYAQYMAQAAQLQQQQAHVQTQESQWKFQAL
jgi:hypothetical protein